MQKSSGNPKASSFFSRHPLFTTGEFEDFMRTRGSTNPQTRRNLLHYFHRQGAIFGVRRGLYGSVPAGTDPESRPVDSYLLASKLAPDAVLAYHSALEIHGRSYSILNRVVFTSKKYPAGYVFRFRGVRYQSVRPPAALVRVGREDVETTLVDRSGKDVRITTLERTFVDVLDRPKLAGGWEEVWRSLESIPYLNLDKVIDYALLLSKRRTIALTGFFLEQHRKELLVEDSKLKRLEQRRPSQPQYLNRTTARKSGRLVTRWNLVIPERILERAWEESA
jgi:predicted transcriptional regulator of viral defense system